MSDRRGGDRRGGDRRGGDRRGRSRDRRGRSRSRSRDWNPRAQRKKAIPRLLSVFAHDPPQEVDQDKNGFIAIRRLMIKRPELNQYTIRQIQEAIEEHQSEGG